MKMKNEEQSKTRKIFSFACIEYLHRIAFVMHEKENSKIFDTKDLVLETLNNNVNTQYVQR